MGTGRLGVLLVTVLCGYFWGPLAGVQDAQQLP